MRHPLNLVFNQYKHMDYLVDHALSHQEHHLPFPLSFCRKERSKEKIIYLHVLTSEAASK